MGEPPNVFGLKTSPMLGLEGALMGCRNWSEDALDPQATARWPAFLRRFARRERWRMARAWRKMAVAYDKGVGRLRRQGRLE